MSILKFLNLQHGVCSCVSSTALKALFSMIALAVILLPFLYARNDFIAVKIAEQKPAPKLNWNATIATNISEAALRRSKLNIGDIHKIHKFLEKLNDKQCVKILVLGGSQSFGHGLENKKESVWHKLLEDWLNDIYPCLNNNTLNKSQHRVINRAENGGHSARIISKYYSFVLQNNMEYDAIFIEESINDASFLPGVDKRTLNRNNGVDGEQLIIFRTELLVRELLLLPYNPLIIYLEMSWNRLRIPFFAQASFAYSKILFYYQISTISSFRSLFPRFVYEMKYNKVLKKYVHAYDEMKYFPLNARHTGIDCCHGNEYVHKFTSLCIAHFIKSEDVIYKNNYNNYKYVYDIINVNGSSLPPLWSMNENQFRKFHEMMQVKPTLDINFVKINYANNLLTYYYGDWNITFDTVHKEKKGLIATINNSLVTIQIKNISKIHLLQISYLKTYENIGTALIWMDNKNEDYPNCSNKMYLRQMDGSINNDASNVVILNGKWNKHYSLTQDDLFDLKRIKPNNESISYIYLCLIHHKFKLLALRTL